MVAIILLPSSLSYHCCLPSDNEGLLLPFSLLREWNDHPQVYLCGVIPLKSRTWGSPPFSSAPESHGHCGRNSVRDRPWNFAQALPGASIRLLMSRALSSPMKVFPHAKALLGICRDGYVNSYFLELKKAWMVATWAYFYKELICTPRWGESLHTGSVTTN